MTANLKKIPYVGSNRLFEGEQLLSNSLPLSFQRQKDFGCGDICDKVFAQTSKEGETLTVEHEVVDYQHNTGVVTNYGHGETIGRLLG